MAEIIKIGKAPAPALRFVGKKYGDEDRVDGLFGAKWDEWFKNNWFQLLEKLNPLEGWGHYMGLMGHEDGVFKYWIGMFLPAETNPPEGFAYMDYPSCNVGFCRLKGREDNIYMNEPMCAETLQQAGFELLEQEFICFERELMCEDPDVAQLNEGEMLLDICFFVK